MSNSSGKNPINQDPKLPQVISPQVTPILVPPKPRGEDVPPEPIGNIGADENIERKVENSLSFVAIAENKDVNLTDSQIQEAKRWLVIHFFASSANLLIQEFVETYKGDLSSGIGMMCYNAACSLLYSIFEKSSEIQPIKLEEYEQILRNTRAGLDTKITVKEFTDMVLRLERVRHTFASHVDFIQVKKEPLFSYNDELKAYSINVNDFITPYEIHQICSVLQRHYLWKLDSMKLKSKERDSNNEIQLGVADLSKEDYISRLKTISLYNVPNPKSEKEYLIELLNRSKQVVEHLKNIASTSTTESSVNPSTSSVLKFFGQFFVAGILCDISKNQQKNVPLNVKNLRNHFSHHSICPVQYLPDNKCFVEMGASIEQFFTDLDDLLKHINELLSSLSISDNA